MTVLVNIVLILIFLNPIKFSLNVEKIRKFYPTKLTKTNWALLRSSWVTKGLKGSPPGFNMGLEPALLPCCCIIW